MLCSGLLFSARLSGRFSSARLFNQRPPPLMLATQWQPNTHSSRIQEFWVSEKYDGVRAYFDGQSFISRTGNIITTTVVYQSANILH